MELLISDLSISLTALFISVLSFDSPLTDDTIFVCPEFDRGLIYWPVTASSGISTSSVISIAGNKCLLKDGSLVSLLEAAPLCRSVLVVSGFKPENRNGLT
jgi:hypothetical protein